MNTLSKWIWIGAFLAGWGVALGAIGAHGLDDYFVQKYSSTRSIKIGGFTFCASYKYLQDFKTGVRYQMWHALGLIGLGLLASWRPSRTLDIAGWSFLTGIVLFSGGLYVLTIGGSHWLGITWGLVVPFGGVAFIVGWIAILVAICPCRKSR